MKFIWDNVRTVSSFRIRGTYITKCMNLPQKYRNHILAAFCCQYYINCRELKMTEKDKESDRIH